jgi:plastocyanin
MASVAIIGAAACGTPTTPTENPQQQQPPPVSGGGGPAPPPLTATIVIGPNNAFSPQEVTIAVGGRLVFVNENNRPHDITSDPPHLHTDCPGLNDVGFIQPGQTRTSPALTVERSCGFHDHMQENNPALHGVVIIKQP